MKEKLIIALICLFGMLSCTIPKEARLLRKTTKDWRESPVILEAYADSPFSGSFLTLRENGKFERTSSGLIKSFEAGSWTNVKDTINLSYLDEEQNVVNKKKVLIDRKTSTLKFEGDDTPVQMRLRIMLNRL